MTDEQTIIVKVRTMKGVTPWVDPNKREEPRYFLDAATLLGLEIKRDHSVTESTRSGNLYHPIIGAYWPEEETTYPAEQARALSNALYKTKLYVEPSSKRLIVQYPVELGDNARNNLDLLLTHICADLNVEYVDRSPPKADL